MTNIRQLCACAVLLVLVALVVPIDGKYTYLHGRSYSHDETRTGVPHNVIADVAQAIKQQVALSQRLNRANGNPMGRMENALEAGSVQASKLDMSSNANIQQQQQQKKKNEQLLASPQFAFLASNEFTQQHLTQGASASAASSLPGVNLSGDVESELALIQTQINSALVHEQTAQEALAIQQKAQMETQAKLKAEEEAQNENENESESEGESQDDEPSVPSKQQQKPASNMRSRMQSIQRQQLQQQSSSSVPSARQQNLINRIDNYRSQRGHNAYAPSNEDASSMVETGSQTNHAQSTQAGYSFPTPFMGAAPGAVPSVNGAGPLNPQGFSFGGFGVPVAPQPQQPPQQTQPNNIAGVGLLLRALKKVQEEQQTAQLVSSLSALLSAAQRPQQQQQVPSPQFQFGPQPIYGSQPTNSQLPSFTYGQPFSPMVPIPYAQQGGAGQGFFNPQTGLSGAMPDMPPASGNFGIGQVGVGVDAFQPNPFQQHQP